MTSTSDRFHDPDAAHLAAQVRCLENEVRALRETLRDKFAAAAVTGMYAADTLYSVVPTERKAEEAYLIADAMLEARKRT
jgi:hypothetical protein